VDEQVPLPLTDRSKLRLIRANLDPTKWNWSNRFPPGQDWRCKRTVILREVVNVLMYILSPLVIGARIPKTFRLKSRFYYYSSICGPMTARCTTDPPRAL